MFTPYLSAESIIDETIITLNDNEVYNVKGGFFGREIIAYIPTISDDLIVGNTYQLSITVKSVAGRTTTANFYVKIEHSSILTLPTPQESNMLCDYIAYGSNELYDLHSSNDKYIFDGDTPVTITQEIKQYNTNLLSGIKGFSEDPTIYRLSNKAYSIMDVFEIGGSSTKTFQDIFQVKK